MNQQNNNNNYNRVLQNLQDYMLNDLNIQKITDNTLSNISLSNKNDEPTKKFDKQPREFFIPKQKDSLFWCFYILKNGQEKYEDIDSTGITIVTEKQLKIALVEKLRNVKQLIKTYKFASLTHIENQLVNENKIDLPTFLTLCVLENLNVFCLKKKTYYELLMNDTNNIHVINLMEYGKFGCKSIFEEKNVLEVIEKYRETLFKIENIEKPLNALSAYKVSELVDFCNKLNISILNEKTNKKKNKNELYESLIQYF
jgi:hypothetical protein